MEGLRKHLVFHFFVPDDYETNIAVKMHYACLWKYHDVFDSAEFFISATEKSKQYVDLVKLTLFNVFHCGDIRFKEVENSSFCEATTFKENVMDKLETFENTIVFFGHTKGVTNVVAFPGEEERFLKWIYALYFYSLEFMYETERKLIAAHMGRFRSLYGSLLTRMPNGRTIFSGSFYWVNPMAVCNDILWEEIELPKFSDRVYAESFPSIYKWGIFNGYYMSKVDGHNCIEANLEDFDLYHCDFDDVVRYYGDYDLFMRNYNELIKEIQ